ncbi:IclR family transcriptional regulator [Actinophytocola oryzae]|nr:IclR family transcriptional regulator [Actinophytocola oryzae]
MSQAALKALGLIEAAARSAETGLGAMDAAEMVGLDKSTASRLLKTLTDAGWLMRDPVSRRYFPGRVLMGVAHATGVSPRLRAVLDATIAPLRDAIGETVVLHQRSGASRVSVAGYESREEIRTGFVLGEARPLTRGPSGKVILALCDEPAPEDLAPQLDFIRAHGYLSTDSDSLPGVSAVSVPVFDPAGVYGALTAAGPEARFDARRRAGHVAELFAVARQVTQILGGTTEHYARWATVDGQSVG